MAFHIGNLRQSGKHAQALLRQLVMFGMVGLTGLGVALGILNLCMKIFDSFPLANVIAFLVAVSWNFLLHRRFTFGRTGKAFWRQWLEFVSACLGGTILNWTVSWTLYYGFPFFHRYYNVAALAGVTVGFLFDFLSARLYVFKPTAPSNKPIPQKTPDIDWDDDALWPSRQSVLTARPQNPSKSSPSSP